MIKILVEGFPKNFGGIAAIVTNLINQFDEDFYFDIIETYEYKGKNEIKNKNVKFIKLPIFKKHYFKYKKELKKVFKKNNYDFVWVNNTSKVNILPFTIAKKYNVKTIAHSHGEGGEESFIKSILYKIISKINEIKFYKNIDLCFACSKNSADYFYNKKKLDNKKVYIINNAINDKDFVYNKEIRQKYRKKLNIDDKVVIGFIGRISKVKNPIFLLKILKRLPDNYILLVVGTGEQEKKFKKYVDKYNLKNRVLMLGYRKDVANIYQLIDIMVLPSFYEGLPLVLLEGQATGLKCVVSDKITRDVDFITGNIKFLDLNNINEWVKEILKNSNYERTSKINELKLNKFSINESYKYLTEILLSEYKN